MSAQEQARLTPEQYLAAERAAEFKHEYYNGQMYARPGGSFQHCLIAGNILGALHTELKTRPCGIGSSDLRLRVSPDGLYTYADVLAINGDPRSAGDEQDTLLNPALIVEVLSPSTEAYDRGFKSAQYRTVESLEEYALVSQSEPRVEVFHRHQVAIGCSRKPSVSKPSAISRAWIALFLCLKSTLRSLSVPTIRSPPSAPPARLNRYVHNLAKHATMKR
jgi:Uma2 family endonuclease